MNSMNWQSMRADEASSQELSLPIEQITSNVKCQQGPLDDQADPMAEYVDTAEILADIQNPPEEGYMFDTQCKKIICDLDNHLKKSQTVCNDKAFNLLSKMDKILERIEQKQAGLKRVLREELDNHLKEIERLKEQNKKLYDGLAQYDALTETVNCKIKKLEAAQQYLKLRVEEFIRRNHQQNAVGGALGATAPTPSWWELHAFHVVMGTLMCVAGIGVLSYYDLLQPKPINTNISIPRSPLHFFFPWI